MIELGSFHDVGEVLADLQRQVVTLENNDLDKHAATANKNYRRQQETNKETAASIAELFERVAAWERGSDDKLDDKLDAMTTIANERYRKQLARNSQESALVALNADNIAGLGHRVTALESGDNRPPNCEICQKPISTIDDPTTHICQACGDQHFPSELASINESLDSVKSGDGPDNQPPCDVVPCTMLRGGCSTCDDLADCHHYYACGERRDDNGANKCVHYGEYCTGCEWIATCRKYHRYRKQLTKPEPSYADLAGLVESLSADNQGLETELAEADRLCERLKSDRLQYEKVGQQFTGHIAYQVKRMHRILAPELEHAGDESLEYLIAGITDLMAERIERLEAELAEAKKTVEAGAPELRRMLDDSNDICESLTGKNQKLEAALAEKLSDEHLQIMHKLTVANDKLADLNQSYYTRGAECRRLEVELAEATKPLEWTVGDGEIVRLRFTVGAGCPQIDSIDADDNCRAVLRFVSRGVHRFGGVDSLIPTDASGCVVDLVERDGEFVDANKPEPTIDKLKAEIDDLRLALVDKAETAPEPVATDDGHDEARGESVEEEPDDTIIDRGRQVMMDSITGKLDAPRTMEEAAFFVGVPPQPEWPCNDHLDGPVLRRCEECESRVRCNETYMQKRE